jgi:hypothetical protein
VICPSSRTSCATAASITVNINRRCYSAFLAFNLAAVLGTTLTVAAHVCSSL